MSLRKHLLNPYLRLTEKRDLARSSLEKVRRSFERKARLLFWAPRGTRYEDAELTHEGQTVAAVRVKANQTDDGPLILYFHGGGYVFGSPRTHRAMLAWLSKLSGLSACLPQYRLAPENVFPAALEDALTAYQCVAGHPGGVILGGDSAGGGLALALLAEITRLDLPQPLGTFAFSALTDLSCSGDSFTANARSEVVLPAARVTEMAQGYLNGADPQTPQASPLFADFSEASPVWLTVGDSEIFLDDSQRLAARLQAQGVDVTLVIEDDLPHVWPIFVPFLPEAKQSLIKLTDWITALSRPTNES